MPMLGDGTVVSSNLSANPLPPASQSYTDEIGLLKGTVIAMYYPDDDANLSKAFIEYDVLVTKRDMRSGSNLLVYKNCQVRDLWGTINNYEDFTLQPATDVKDGIPEGGAQVLILCPDGISVSGGAVIVGARKTLENSPSKDRGQYYEKQFNGINIQINKDGEYTIEFKSPIGQDGNPVSEDAAKAAGTTLKIDKDGRFSVVDNEKQSFLMDRVEQKMTWANENDSITIDKKNKTISVSSSKDVSSESKEATSIKSGKDTSVEADGKISAKAGGDVNVEAGGNLQEKAGGNWQVNVSGNATVNAGGNLSMMAGGNATVQGTINTIGTGGIQAAGVAISQAFGSNGGGPMLSTIITGSSTCFIGA